MLVLIEIELSFYKKGFDLVASKVQYLKHFCYYDLHLLFGKMYK